MGLYKKVDGVTEVKQLIMISGTMGVGKTAAGLELKKLLPAAVFLDGDWCWDMDPFIVTDETKTMVQDNIVFLLNRFLHCSAFERIIFCWVMHQQEIIDGLLARLDTKDCQVHVFSLICSPECLAQRIQKDIAAGCRTPDVWERTLARLPLYDRLDTVKIQTDALTPRETAQAIAEIVGSSTIESNEAT